MSNTINVKGFLSMKYARDSITPSGKRVINFQVNDKVGKDKDGKPQYQYLNCVVVGDNCEVLASMSPDSFVELSGILKIKSYEKSGIKKTIAEIFVLKINQLLKDEQDHKLQSANDNFNNW